MALKYKHTILLVDDEAAITMALQRLFLKEGYHVIAAPSGKEGVEMLKKWGKPVSLIISDQRMPEMTGVEFLEAAKKIFPTAIRFLLTGYSDMGAIVDAVNKGEIHRYLTKPWNDNDLLLQVRHCLEQFELMVENRKLAALTKKQNKELNELNSQLEQKVRKRAKEIMKKNTDLLCLNKELEKSFFNTIRAFASLTEMYAPFLAGHGRRVSSLSRMIAQGMNLPENEVVHIEIAALLHDIGKLGFPPTLINYGEDKWSAEEKSKFQKHPQEGQSIVRFINKLDHVGLMIRSHHERCDGLGYPDKLKGETIPLGSKIIAVADAYDKLVYLKVNEKIHIQEYLKERQVSQDHLPQGDLIQQAAAYRLKTHAFTWYDPEVVKTFLDIFQTKGISFREEKQVSIEDLKVGMVLSRSLYTSRGRFLLPYDTVLTRDYIAQLKITCQNEPMDDAVWMVEA